VKLSDDEILLDAPFIREYGVCQEQIGEKNEAGSSFPRMRNFLPLEQKTGKISRTVNGTAKCLPERERENFNHALFALGFFSRRQDRELPCVISRGLLDCPRRV
jgi:hypothetical protein